MSWGQLPKNVNTYIFVGRACTLVEPREYNFLRF